MEDRVGHHTVSINNMNGLKLMLLMLRLLATGSVEGI